MTRTEAAQFDADHEGQAVGHIVADAWQHCHAGDEASNLAAFEARWFREARGSMIRAVEIGLCVAPGCGDADALDRLALRRVVAAVLATARTDDGEFVVDFSQVAPGEDPLLAWLQRQPSPAPVALAGRLPADAVLGLLPQEMLVILGVLPVARQGTLGGCR